MYRDSHYPEQLTLKEAAVFYPVTSKRPFAAYCFLCADEHIEIMSRLARQLIELARKGLSRGPTHNRRTMSLRLLQVLLEEFSSLWAQDLRKGDSRRALSTIGGVRRSLTLDEFNPLPPDLLSLSTVDNLMGRFGKYSML